MWYNVITYSFTSGGKKSFMWWCTLKCLLHVQMTMTYLLTVTKQMAINQNELLRTGDFSFLVAMFMYAVALMDSGHSCSMEEHVDTSHVC